MQTYVEEKSTNFWNVMICGRSRNDPYFFLSYIYTRIQHRFTLEHYVRSSKNVFSVLSKFLNIDLT